MFGSTVKNGSYLSWMTKKVFFFKFLQKTKEPSSSAYYQLVSEVDLNLSILIDD